MELLAALNVVGGLIYLVMGGDLLIRGSISIARRLQVPPAIIGATIVALGTSLPELVVSVLAATKGAGGLAMGNVIGSNIANVLLILGVPALIAPVVAAPSMRSHSVFMVFASLLFAALCFTGTLTTWHGALLLGVMAVAMLLSFTGKLSLLDLEGEDTGYRRVLGFPENAMYAWFFVIFGAIILPLGANLTVDGAIELAASFGIPDAAIGATVVAIGTSLPELSVSIMAARHNQLGMAIGNAVGSNTMNILVVLGATALFADLPVPPRVMIFDLWLMLGCALVLLALLFSGKAIGRKIGSVFLLVYVAYVWVTLTGVGPGV